MITNTKSFKREPRYVALKIKDIHKYLSLVQAQRLQDILEQIKDCRAKDGKEPLITVVVEHDWPEFEPVWKMIEERTTKNE